MEFSFKQLRKERWGPSQNKEDFFKKNAQLRPNDDPLKWYPRLRMVKKIWVRLIKVFEWLHGHGYCHLVRAPLFSTSPSPPPATALARQI